MYRFFSPDIPPGCKAVKLGIVRNRRNTSTHAFSRRYQPSLPPLYAPVSTDCAAGAATRICRQPDRALTAGGIRGLLRVRRDYVDSAEMFFTKCKLPINKQLERYAWFGGSAYAYKVRGWSPILSGSRVSYKISRT